MDKEENLEVVFASRRVVDGVIFEALTLVRRQLACR
jgi:hypothetical protein